MNLLSIQDALKNASDQQLVQLMRAPDSTTPSYLVVSELNRRKQMRVKQAEPPSRTVAEDLTSEENMQAPMGIRSLQTPEPGDEEYRPEDEAGIEAMREGGIVRMNDGGRPRPATPGDFYGTPMLDLENQAINEDYERAMSGIETDFRNRQIQSGRAIDDTSQAMADIRSRISSGTAPEQAITEAMPGYRRADESGIRQLLGLPPRQTTPAAAPATVAPTEAARPATPAAVAPPAGAAQPSAQRPGGGGGIGASRPAAPAAAAPDAMPTLQQNMERNLGMFPGIPQELLDRIRDSRTNEGDRRREAQNMALLEAGLRIAGSNNPNFLGAIGEGATPAAQTYAQQLSQIRQDRRSDIQTDLAVAQADLQRRYMAGQISAAELQRQTQMLMSREERASRLEAARIAAGGADARASRAEEAANQRHQATMSGQRQQLLITANREVSKEVNDIMGDISRLTAARIQYSSPGRPPLSNSELQSILRTEIQKRVYGDFNIPIPARVSDTSRPGAAVESGVSR
jgi:hypothetical protein